MPAPPSVTSPQNFLHRPHTSGLEPDTADTYRTTRPHPPTFNRRSLENQFHDALTGLPMAPLFEAQITPSLQRDDAFALIIVNCLKFRRINDFYGRELANQVLRLVAYRLNKFTRDDIYLARLHNDRFGFVVHNKDAAEVQALVQQVAQILRRPMRFRGQRYQLGFAMGLHWRRRSQCITAQDLILDAQATIGLSTKHGSQEVVSIYECPQLIPANEELQIKALEQQLKSKTLPIKVFPVINIRTGMKYSYQAVPALLDNGEELPLHTIFRLAERGGLMTQLTEYTVDKAVTQFQEIYAELAMYLSVKISRLDIQNCRLMEHTYRRLAQAGLPIHKFKFELHEHIMTDDWQAVINEMFELANADCASQFKRFQRSPKFGNETELHITKVMWLQSHLIRQAHNDAQHMQMLRCVIDLARAQGVDIMVEGLENTDDAKLSLELGILFAQGTGFGQPSSLLMVN